MSGFWSGWVKFLVVLNLGITFLLFIMALRIKIPTQPDGTTGHVWAHGVLREGVRKLPLWWALFSAAMFIVGFAYLALYPGFGGFKGVLGWTSAEELQRDVQANNAKIEAVLQSHRAQSLEELAGDPTAIEIGRRLYLDNCAACHGVEARGNQVFGAPNLSDGDWLYGGDAQSILASIRDGRNGVMPAWGGALGREGVNEAAAYVLSLSGVNAPADWVAAGKTRYETMCVACHGADGRGNSQLGAPNLTDDAWLYGSDFAQVTQTIRDGRTGVMPSWQHRLSEDEMRTIAAWLVALGRSAETQQTPHLQPTS
jgi:cytochrome c oxidase cbb3-type subunit 3